MRRLITRIPQHEYSTQELNAIISANLTPDATPQQINDVVNTLKNAVYISGEELMSAVPYVLKYILQSGDDESLNETKRDIFMGLLDMKYLEQQINGRKLIEYICERGDFLSNADLFFIIKNTDIKEQYYQGKTLFHNACASGNIKVAEVLIQNGADINGVDDQGNTPLSLACRVGKKEMFDFLLSCGADIHKQYPHGRNLLHIIADSPIMAMGAMLNRRDEYAQPLIDRGIDINAKDENGKTPLHIAAEKNNAELATIICKSLLTKKSNPPFADPFIKDSQGKKPMEYATNQATKDVLKQAQDIKLKTVLRTPATITRSRNEETQIQVVPADLTRKLFDEHSNGFSNQPLDGGGANQGNVQG